MKYAKFSIKFVICRLTKIMQCALFMLFLPSSIKVKLVKCILVYFRKRGTIQHHPCRAHWQASWLFITLLNFLHCIYGANYPVTTVVFSLLGAGALNHWAAPNEPPLWKKPTNLNFNRNSISAKKFHSKPGLNEGCGHVWSKVPHVSKCHVVSNMLKKFFLIEEHIISAL